MLRMEVRVFKSLLEVLKIEGKTLAGELAQIGRFGKNYIICANAGKIHDSNQQATYDQKTGVSN